MDRTARWCMVVLIGGLCVASAWGQELVGPLDPVVETVEPTVDVPLPKVIGAARLKPWADDKAERATMPLDQVLERLAIPTYLLNDPPGADHEDADLIDPDAQKAYIAARDAVRQSKFKEALQLLEQAIALDDRFADAYLLRGRVYVDIGDKAKAVESFEAAVLRDHDSSGSLYRLGQLAFENGKADECVVVLARALEFADEMDPGATFASQFFLGHALLSMGYDHAAEGPLREFLAAPDGFGRSTRLFRQVNALSQRRDGVVVQVGDVMMRLDRPHEAVALYAEVADSPRLIADELGARRVYALLRAGRCEEAERLVVDWFDPPSPRWVMQLADYVATHTDDLDRYTALLRRAYAQGGAESDLALLIGRLLPHEVAARFLATHLDDRTMDRLVYQAYIERYAADRTTEAVGQSLMWITRTPAMAREIIVAWADSELDGPTLQAALDGLADDQKAAPAGLYFQGMIHLKGQDFDAAERAYHDALDMDPDFLPAQIGIIELMITRGQSRQALELLSTMRQTDDPRLQWLRATALLQIGQAQQARSILDQLVRKSPDRTDYLMFRYLAEKGMDDWDAVEQTLLSVLRMDAQLESAYEALFDVYETHRPDGEKFRQLLITARQSIPNARITRLKTARYYSATQEPNKAELILRSLVADYPTDTESLRLLSAVLGRNGRWDEVYDLLDGLLDKNPTNAGALKVYKSVTDLRGDHARYLERYKVYLESQPQTPMNMVLLGRYYEQAGDLEGAISAYRRGLDGEPDEVLPARLSLVRVYRDSGDLDAALVETDRLIHEYPDQISHQMLKAQLLADAERYVLAEQVIGDAIAAYPEAQVELRLAMSQVIAQQGDLDRAMLEIDQLIGGIGQPDPQLLYLKAQLIHDSVVHADAYEQLLLDAIEIDQNYAPANNDLAYWYARRAIKLDDAEQMAVRAVRFNPNSSAYMDTLGWVRYQQGNYDEAVRLLTRASQMDQGDDPVVQAHLGDALWQTGKTDTAVERWEQAVEALVVMLEGEGSDRLPTEYKQLLPKLRERLKAASEGGAPLGQPVLQEDG